MSRPRGLIEWEPTAKVVARLGMVKSVLAEYRRYLPLTVRQIFYRLVGAYDYAKTENAYSRLCDTLVKARRSGIIPFSSIRDDGVVASKAPGFSSARSFVRGVIGAAEDFRLTRQGAQDEFLEVWVEAAGMVPQVASMAHGYGVDVYSCGGFDSLDAKWEAANRLARRESAVVLHVGDLDPSGVAMFDAVREDVSALADDAGFGACIHFERVAVTPKQVARYSLPTAPPKTTDRRKNYQGQTTQAEALPPDVLLEEIERAIFRHHDRDVWAETVDRESEEREWLVNELKKLSE